MRKIEWCGEVWGEGIRWGVDVSCFAGAPPRSASIVRYYSVQFSLFLSTPSCLSHPFPSLRLNLSNSRVFAAPEEWFWAPTREELFAVTLLMLVWVLPSNKCFLKYATSSLEPPRTVSTSTKTANPTVLIQNIRQQTITYRSFNTKHQFFRVHQPIASSFSGFSLVFFL